MVTTKIIKLSMNVAADGELVRQRHVDECRRLVEYRTRFKHYAPKVSTIVNDAVIKTTIHSITIKREQKSHFLCNFLPSLNATMSALTSLSVTSVETTGPV